MTVRVLKALAVGCLAISIGAIVGSVRATLGAGEIQGPSALVVTPSGEVWIGVDDLLWRVSAQGSLVDEQPIRATGLPGPPANLARGPAGAIVATVRGDPTLYFLDVSSARAIRRLTPQWPPELQRHGARAINFAFDAHGRVAIATGGGDAVALFEADGRFVARTAPGAYVFTNGLWWSDEGLWTTDTNRYTLRLLDRITLVERKAVELGEAVGGSFLGPARGREAQADARAPVAALIRYYGDMTQGGLNRVSADGRVSVLPQGAEMEPRDVDWLGDELLVTDGKSFAVMRWSADGRAQPPFGDAALHERLRASAAQRETLRMEHVRWLVAAGSSLLLGLVFAALVPWAARRTQPAQVLDLSRLGTPQLGRRELFRLQVRLNGALLVAGLPMLLLALLIRATPRDTLKAWLSGISKPVLMGFGVAAMLLMLLLTLLALMLALRHVRRLSRLPVFEPALNQRALGQLKSHPQMLARELRSGEQVLEAFSLLPGMSWWVLTDQRLLAFRPGLFDATLAAAHELADVRGVSTVPGSIVALGRLRGRPRGNAWLEIGFTSALPISGLVGSPVLGVRLAQRIEELSASRRALSPPAATRPGLSADLQARRRRRAIASALLPGLGQWQQRRAGEAIVFLASWAAVLIFGSAPMLWTLFEPFTGVSPTALAVVLSVHLMLSMLAAGDAWRSDALAAA